VSLPVPKMEESDEELSNIEKIAMVHMLKKDEKGNSRPMSWEGIELSENEEMMVDEKHDSIVQLPVSSDDVEPKFQLIDDKKLIKPEVCSPEDLMGNGQKSQHFLNVNLSSKKSPEVMNLKYEPSTSNDYSKESMANAPIRSKQSLVSIPILIFREFN
jgi:uncharacterized protein YacL (UPF0231 family)